MPDNEDSNEFIQRRLEQELEGIDVFGHEVYEYQGALTELLLLIKVVVAEMQERQPELFGGENGEDMVLAVLVGAAEATLDIKQSSMKGAQRAMFAELRKRCTNENRALVRGLFKEGASA